MLSSSFDPSALSKALALGAKWTIGLIRKPNILLELACLANFVETKRFVSQINKWEASTALHTHKKEKRKKNGNKKSFCLFSPRPEGVLLNFMIAKEMNNPISKF